MHLLLALPVTPVMAEHVTTQLGDGTWVNADYHAAESGKPTVLLIHPFQQTNNFATTYNLAESLRDHGYGVLSPNLSLGFSNRKQGIACEAIHFQSLIQDSAEVGFWIDWLASKSISHIIGIGHSTGNLQILAYPGIDKLTAQILISPVSIEPYGPAKIDPVQLATARQAKAEGLPDDLGGYVFSYCQNYVTSRDAYLETAEWDATKLASRLNELPQQAHVIVGDEDYELSQEWLTAIRNPLVQIHRIADANHFFSGVEEFDLHDKVLQILDGLK